jgi:hypothetical protein
MCSLGTGPDCMVQVWDRLGEVVKLQIQANVL